MWSPSKRLELQFERLELRFERLEFELLRLDSEFGRLELQLERLEFEFLRLVSEFERLKIQFLRLDSEFEPLELEFEPFCTAAGPICPPAGGTRVEFSPMENTPIEPGHPLEEAARRRPWIVFVPLGLFLGLVEAFLVRGGRYDWAVKFAVVTLGGYLGGVLKQKLGIEKEDETEEDGQPRALDP